VLLERIVAEARRFTTRRPDAVPEEGGALRFAVVQNEPFVPRFGAADTRAWVGAERLALDLPGLAATWPRRARRSCCPTHPACPMAASTSDAPTGQHALRAGGAAAGAGGRRGWRPAAHQRARRGRRGDPFAAAFEGSCARSPRRRGSDSQRHARDLSFKDPLTGAYNRRYFMLRIEEEAKRHTRYGEPVSSC